MNSVVRVTWKSNFENLKYKILFCKEIDIYLGIIEYQVALIYYFTIKLRKKTLN